VGAPFRKVAAVMPQGKCRLELLVSRAIALFLITFFYAFFTPADATHWCFRETSGGGLFSNQRGVQHKMIFSVI
jgi:hypothetical protein